MIVSVRSLPPQAFFSTATGNRPLTHTATTSVRNPPSPYGFVLDDNRRVDTGVSCIINPEWDPDDNRCQRREDASQENRRKNTSVRSWRFPARTKRERKREDTAKREEPAGKQEEEEEVGTTRPKEDS